MRGRLIANREKKEEKRRYILMAQIRVSFSFGTTFNVVIIFFRCQVMFCGDLNE
jgi:hypothetical protein